MPAHQVLPLTAYIFEASYSTSATQASKIQSIDQSELLNPRAGIGTLTVCNELSGYFDISTHRDVKTVKTAQGMMVDD